jgi:nucleotide-binding universal stress UspA family protein
VTLLYVSSEPGEINQLARFHLDRAEASLHALDVPVEVRIRQGQTTVEGILAESEAGEHDLIVIGRQEPSSISFPGVSDVVQQVLFKTDRPVLIVPGKES